MKKISYKGHRVPAKIIRQAVWIYSRFTLSFRDIEDLLAECGLDVPYESIRRWFLKFGPQIAQNIRRARSTTRDYWHLEEMVIVIQERRSSRAMLLAMACRRQ